MRARDLGTLRLGAWMAVLALAPKPESQTTVLELDAGATVQPIEYVVAEAGAGDDPVFELSVQPRSAGRLYAWARSNHDLDLRAVAAGAVLGFDRNTGGGGTPFLALEVQPGRRIDLQVLSPDAQGAGTGELHLRLAAEEVETHDLGLALIDARTEVTSLVRGGALEEARELLDALIAEARALDPDATSPALTDQVWELAFLALEQRTFATARDAFGAVLQHRERNLPATHFGIQLARVNKAISLKWLGDAQQALELEKEAYEVAQRTLPEDSPWLQDTRFNLSKSFALVGRPQEARALLELVYENESGLYPHDHERLQDTRLALASLAKGLGDYRAAREREQEVVDVLEAKSPPLSQRDRELYHLARSNLAVTLKNQGEARAASILEEAVLADLLKERRPDDPDVLRLLQNRATTQKLLGAFEEAREIEEQVLETRLSTLRPDHRDVQASRHNLGNTLAQLGRLDEAHALHAAVLEVNVATLPPDHPELHLARLNLALTNAWLGNTETARGLALELLEGIEVALRLGVGASSMREAEELAANLAEMLGGALSLGAETGDAKLNERSFALVESLRGSGLLAARLGLVADARLEQLRSELRRASEAYVRTARSAEPSALARLRRERERAERDLVQRLFASPETQALAEKFTAEALAAKLEEDEAALGYWTYRHQDTSERTGPERARMQDRIAAFVLHRGRLSRVELGSAETIRRAISDWRQALTPEPGDGPKRSVRESGIAVRELVLDPLLPALASAKRVQVAFDDALHLVPLDALPTERGLVGDGLHIHARATLWELLLDVPAIERAPVFLGVGGIEYGEHALGTEAGKPVPSAQPALRPGARRFEPLEATREEIEGLAALLTPSGISVQLLLGKDASRTTLATQAPRARYLHLATHGYFAPESVPSRADRQGGDDLRLSQTDLGVHGFSPLVLSGLALANANLPTDDYGRLPGVLTAEELATWDLSGCELAVLSACDTNVGVLRAGQGVASLQKALHMAGARAVLTSLWQVPDSATKELMLEFYRKIWKEGATPSQALWEAKRHLRRQRPAPRYWAGWVLTGVTNRPLAR